MAKNSFSVDYKVNFPIKTYEDLRQNILDLGLEDFYDELVNKHGPVEVAFQVKEGLDKPAVLDALIDHLNDIDDARSDIRVTHVQNRGSLTGSFFSLVE